MSAARRWRPYRHLSVAEKETYARDHAPARPPSVACPYCGLQTTPRHLLSHIASGCDGRRQEHHADEYVTFREALNLGVPRAELSRWVHSGRVRQKLKMIDGAMRRVYRLCDIVMTYAIRRGSAPGTAS